MKMSEEVLHSEMPSCHKLQSHSPHTVSCSARRWLCLLPGSCQSLQKVSYRKKPKVFQEYGFLHEGQSRDLNLLYRDGQFAPRNGAWATLHQICRGCESFLAQPGRTAWAKDDSHGPCETHNPRTENTFLMYFLGQGPKTPSVDCRVAIYLAGTHTFKLYFYWERVF